MGNLSYLCEKYTENVKKIGKKVGIFYKICYNAFTINLTGGYDYENAIKDTAICSGSAYCTGTYRDIYRKCQDYKCGGGKH